MRIGLITGEYPPMQGGVGAFTHELGTALVDLGHEVHVITRVGCGPEAGSLRATSDESRTISDTQHASHSASLQGLETHLAIHPIVPDWGWRSYNKVARIARRLDLDVLDIQYQVAAYDLHPAINLMPWRANFSSAIRRPWDVGQQRPAVVVTFHDLKVPYLFPKAGPLRDWIVTFLARQADAAIVTNRADELTLTARGVDRIERIPIGSNIAPVLPKNYDRDAWREALDVTRKGFLLGFFGFFNARKGIETLIRALAVLDPSYQLLFIGGIVGSSDITNRAYADQMIALIEELRLSDRVHFTGYVSETEVSAAFAAVDLCVLPYADGISFQHGTLMAALAHNQPIVSTQPSVELPELVHGENVWLVPPEEPDALAAAISALAANPVRRRNLAQGAAQLSAQFSWERIAARTADLFESVRRET